MFYELYKFWKKYNYIILFIFFIFIILLISLFKLHTKSNYYPSLYFHKPIRINKYTNSNSNFTRESKGEVECRRILEKIFNKPFNKIRPDFLKNEVTGGRHLELDCYNDELKLSLEYDGSQHRKYNPYFHKTHDAFQNQKYRDYMKNRLCMDNGIKLIRVPDTIPHNKIEEYIISKLRFLGYKL